MPPHLAWVMTSSASLACTVLMAQGLLAQATLLRRAAAATLAPRPRCAQRLKGVATPLGVAGASSGNGAPESRREVVVLPQVDASGRAAPGAFGRESAAAGAACCVLFLSCFSLCACLAACSAACSKEQHGNSDAAVCSSTGLDM